MEDGEGAITSPREQLPSWEEAEVKYLLQLCMAYCNLGDHLESGVGLLFIAVATVVGKLVDLLVYLTGRSRV